MPHICYCIDAPDSAEKRQATMAAHFAYVEQIIDEIEVAGPLRDSAADSPQGSCIIYRSNDRETALRLLHADPYYQAGIWQEVRCHHFNAAAGNWVGGTTW
jgi:uncharacterized protein YciI